MAEHSWMTDANQDAWKTIWSHAGKHHTTATHDGMHRNTVYPLMAFGDLLDVIDRHSETAVNHVPREFLDIGCGAGQLMAIAAEYFGYFVDGFDIDPNMVQAAQELFENLGNPFTYVWEQDATGKYVVAGYDVIVLNRLFVGPGQQEELERKVFKLAKRHAYIVKLNNITIPSRDEADPIASNSKGGIVVLKK